MTVQVVEISGAPRERGRQYGEAARNKIDRAIEWGWRVAELKQRLAKGR